MRRGAAKPVDSVRRYPRIEVTHEQVGALLAPLYGRDVIDAVEPVEGGLTNTLLRISLKDGTGALLLRVFASGGTTWERERDLLGRIGTRLPVPDVLLADGGHGSIPYPSLLFRWIDGVNLNTFRRQTSPSTLLLLAEPLGQLLAAVSRGAVPPDARSDGPRRPPESSVDALLLTTEERLRRGRARARLGPELADGLWDQLSRAPFAPGALGPSDCLVHGDLSGRNVLVAQDDAGGCRIAALLDWEDAFAGWPLWDVGSLFRYPRRYSEDFQSAFANGYRSVGGRLPDGWWRTSRLLDATRQIATLSEEQDRPEVFADCRELLEELVRQEG